ncbi:beta-N-acetylhexosaminidase [Echinicola strongylocentroti]|uniref:beta-N-acetylhexosaminidase n=1 Tax=Echinicola strongylocentroti TaxID=1795355 RepID=A0A2Z4ILV3_9BACT|nr:beta-N-acetylhexosaminidase [Echinicola strongylocentroti]AWW31697.1 beta-N-acetylhexosaminidase [Echinicola strongylocentroti]
MAVHITGRISVVLLAVALLFSCGQDPKMSSAALIPLPDKVSEAEGAFEIDKSTKIHVHQDAGDMRGVADFLAGFINNSTGFNVQVVEKLPETGNYISLSQSGSGEAYKLGIDHDRVQIEAGSAAGAFWAVQTLRQLLPVEIEKPGTYEGVSWKVPAGTIEDDPEYAYRGSMLDVARHFFDVNDVKRYIDLMAMYKFNHLHLHLADDQGWRIEIKSWPKLTQIGGSTEVGGGEGGFYTQEEYKEIVRYAQERFITIVPEIDMPGHTNAALASYPELNCNDEAPELYTGIEVGFSTLCTDKEVTYQFIDDVVRELVEMTPGSYIHIGGDESHVTALEDYIPFIEQVQDIVNSYDKQVIGWDEIAHAALRPSTTAQYWAKAENAKMAVEQGAKVLISPASKAYLDMQYDSTSKLGLHWAAYIELDSAYMWEPTELVEGVGKEDILGVEAPLWTETIEKMDDIEYMVFPRLLGIAEVAWTSPDQRDWESYKSRLRKHTARLEVLKVDYYRSPLLEEKEEEK